MNNNQISLVSFIKITIPIKEADVGVTYFPLVWIPTIIVSIVMFSHLVSIRQLITQKKSLSI